MIPVSHNYICPMGTDWYRTVKFYQDDAMIEILPLSGYDFKMQVRDMAGGVLLAEVVITADEETNELTLNIDHETTAEVSTSGLPIRTVYEEKDNNGDPILYTGKAARFDFFIKNGSTDWQSLMFGNFLFVEQVTL